MNNGSLMDDITASPANNGTFALEWTSVAEDNRQ